MNEPLEPELDFKRAQRRRQLIGALVAVLGIGAIAVGFAVSRANKLPALDPEEVKNVRAALDQVSPEHRPGLAARALAELEHERLPSALVAAFDDFNAVPPDMVDLVLLRTITDEPEIQRLWLEACPNGLAIVAEAGSSGGGAALVYERCDLGRLGLLSESELGGATIGTLVVTHAAWSHLVSSDSETEIERRLLRTILGRG
jgi:hypothetical protein